MAAAAAAESSDSSEYLDITAELASRAVTGILCDSSHTPVSRICRLSRRLCIDLQIGTNTGASEKKLHMCFQAAKDSSDYLVAELCSTQSAKINPIAGIEKSRLLLSSLQFAALSNVGDMETSFSINNVLFIYRFGMDGYLADGLLQALGGSAYISNNCARDTTATQQGSGCLLCTHVVMIS